MAKLLYDTGLSLIECLRLRVKDIEFAQQQIAVESELHQQVWRAGVAGGNVAPWLHDMLRQSTAMDFPASWRAGDAQERGSPAGRSHDSRA
jgi:site-specific recombinase XerD